MVDLRFASSVQIMLTLANHTKPGEGLITSIELAEGLGTNPAFVRKLLIPLADAKLIETFKGKSGGVRISKLPKQITLQSIYTAAVDKDIACTRDTANKDCPVGSKIEKVLYPICDGMKKAVSKYLESITLQQLMNNLK